MKLRPSPGRALPVIPPSASGQTGRSKPAAPTPPASPKPANKLTNNHHSSPARHVPISHRNGDSNGAPPPPPEKGPQAEKLNMGRKLPVPPPTTDASPLPTNKFSSPAKSNHVSIKEAGRILFIIEIVNLFKNIFIHIYNTSVMYSYQFINTP